MGERLLTLPLTLRELPVTALCDRQLGGPRVDPVGCCRWRHAGHIGGHWELVPELQALAVSNDSERGVAISSCERDRCALLPEELRSAPRLCQQYQKALLRPETVAGLTPSQRRVLALDDAENDRLSSAATRTSGFLK